MQTEKRADTMSYLQTVTTVAVIVFALLLVTVERPMRFAGRDVLPVALGIVGLLFVAAGLMAMAEFRTQRQAASTDEHRDLMPVMFEVGLWALAGLYVVRLVEIARG